MTRGDNFRSIVESVVQTIPYGKVMTYGQIATICGRPRAARIVGGIAHFGDDNFPWHRVVNARGGLATGYPGGRIGHRTMLEAEGVAIKSFALDLKKYQYMPKL